MLYYKTKVEMLRVWRIYYFMRMFKAVNWEFLRTKIKPWMGSDYQIGNYIILWRDLECLFLCCLHTTCIKTNIQTNKQTNKHFNEFESMVENTAWRLFLENDSRKEEREGVSKYSYYLGWSGVKWAVTNSQIFLP